MKKNCNEPMFKKLGCAAAVALCLAAGAPVQAADTASHSVNFTVASINEIEIDAGVLNLTVDSATAGSQPTPANAASSYAITTNAATDGKKITAALDTPMPTGITLAVDMAAPSGSSASAGSVELGTTAVDVVNGIEGVAASGVAINYQLSATVAAAPVTGTKTVTYTIADEA